MKTQFTGAADTIESLRGVKFGVGNRVLKMALGKQASKAVKIAKGLVSVSRTGILKKSIGSIYRSPRRVGSGGVFVIGPRKSFSGRIESPTKPSKFTQYWSKYVSRKTGQKLRKIKVSKATLKRFKGLFVDPTKYAHLVEGGRKTVTPTKKKVLSDGTNIWGTSAHRVKAAPFMRPTLNQMSNSNAEIAADVKAGLSREVAKYAKKGKSIYGVPGS
jgi:hypothetical protein